MPTTRTVHSLFHAIHAILLSFPIALFASALASDITYLNSAEIQWSNISQWAITGALIFGAPVVIWAIVMRLRGGRSPVRRRLTLYLALVAAMWVVGLINAFKHSQDAWSSVGTVGLMLSLLCASLAIAAGWVGHAMLAMGEPA